MQGEAQPPPAGPDPRASPAAPPPPGPNPYGQYPPAQYPAPNPYGAYPPQPYGGGYPYAPPYPYYPPALPDPPGTSAAGVAMVFWVLLFVRHIVMLLLILLVGTFLGLFAPVLGLSIAALAVFPLIGVVGALIAIVSDVQKRNHILGTIGAVMAIVGCFPGALTFGVAGVALGILGLVFHFMAKPAFAK